MQYVNEDKVERGQWMGLGTSISSSLRHQRGINQGDVLLLIYAQVLVLSIHRGPTPCPQGSAVTSPRLSSLPQASAGDNGEATAQP